MNTARLHRITRWEPTIQTTYSAKTCPPCTQACNQGDDCPARLAPAEACTELGADDLPLRCRPIWSLAVALTAWAAVIGAGLAVWAHST